MSVNSATSFTRRSLMKRVAWSAPVIAVALSAPFAAASPGQTPRVSITSNVNKPKANTVPQFTIAPDPATPFSMVGLTMYAASNTAGIAATGITGLGKGTTRTDVKGMQWAQYTISAADKAQFGWNWNGGGDKYVAIYVFSGTTLLQTPYIYAEPLAKVPAAPVFAKAR